MPQVLDWIAALAPADAAMSRIVFLDTVSPLPYDTRSFGERAVQGTEASVMRIADCLGAWVMQHNRTSAWERYLPVQSIAAVEHVVVIRESRALAQARELFPNAQLHLWLHDKLRPGSKRGRRLRQHADLLRSARGLHHLRVGHASAGCAEYTALGGHRRPVGVYALQPAG